MNLNTNNSNNGIYVEEKNEILFDSLPDISSLPPPLIPMDNTKNIITSSIDLLQSTITATTTITKKQRHPKQKKSKAKNKRPLLNEKNQSELENLTEMDLELKHFKCPRCPLTFQSTHELFTHMRQKYKQPTKCHECGKQLRCMANILSHSYVHTGEKPYICPNCGYSTRTRFNLRVHLGSCAGIEKFTYHRNGSGSNKRVNPYGKQFSNYENRRSRKRRKIANNKKSSKNINSKNANEINLQANNNVHDTNVITDNNVVLHDLLYMLKDSGKANNERNESCLIQVHISSIPIKNNNNLLTVYDEKEQQERQMKMNFQNAFNDNNNMVYNNIPMDVNVDNGHLSQNQQYFQPTQQQWASMNVHGGNEYLANL